MPNGSALPGRSYLYVPGHRDSRHERAVHSGADDVIVDLEDAVPADAKKEARTACARLLERPPAGARVWARVNSHPAHLAADLAAVVSPSLTGVWVPKAEPALLAEVDERLTALEREAGVPAGATAVVALLETAEGVLRVEQVCRSPRVVRLGIGEADLAGELRLRPDEQSNQLHGVRLAVVLASAAAGLAPPVGPVEISVHDEERLHATTTLLLRQGFRARTALHPRQVPVINAVFTPTPQEVEEATELLAVLAEAQRQGQATAVDPSGRLVDPAVVRSAQEVLDRAR
ncbi:citrate lyase subunit beta / citryl-CoA lyase [Lentzea fradiae]|uniref:Citrate lyase subunit beta / citryl-CoA lyase n=1 Tax=Lentzea fradiae TaxID=200378 RepID=A0A1G7KD89_9PSEU|nr:CoA ester lyase [Lentzea fradiae]SDF34954.1 citrate lyase subunit beta / citryl-CoA lyase [Lentzea fradiae]